MFKIQKIALVLIFLLGLFLRIYQLGNVPVGFHRDEAFLGYNAYSILQTGKDITGHFLPLNLESFLFSPAGYSYASIPFIALFGLSEFAVRFPSALFGSLTILIVYFLTKKIFTGFQISDLRFKKNHQTIQSSPYILHPISYIPLTASALLALSPWHINLSRVATENVLVVFFITLGTLIYLRWLDKNKIYLLFISFASFALTLAIYQAPRAFLPLFIPLLLAVFAQKSRIKKMILPFLLYLTLIILPVIIILSSNNLSQRIRMLSIFQHPGTQLVLNEQIREDGAAASRFVTRAFHNKVINYSSTFLQNYASHFSYNFLLTDSGLPDRYRVPQMGLLYLLDIPLIIFGLVKLLNKEKKIAAFLIGWVLIAPIGSALTFDDIPNLQRTLIIFPALSIIAAFGLVEFFNTQKIAKSGLYFKIILIILFLYNFLFYIHQYYVHQIAHRPWYRQEGYRELVSQVNKLLPGYKKAVITDVETAPEIFFLFYSKYDPRKFQTELKVTDWKSTAIKFGKYTFSPHECPIHIDTYEDPLMRQEKIYVRGERGVLYVNSGSCKNPQKYIKTISDIKRSDTTTVFKISEMR